MYFSNLLMVWYLQYYKIRHCFVKRLTMAGKDGDDGRPLRDVRDGMKSASSTSKKADKKYFYLKNLLGGLKKQNIT